jgi:hypothetical protein
MKLEGYTPEIFLENFINDSEVFGEETAKAIYEEIFSTICGKKVKLDCFTKALNESLNKVGDVEVFLETPADDRYLQDYIKTTAKQHFLGKARTSKGNFSLQTVSNQLNAALEQAPGSEAERIARMGLAEIDAKSDELAAKAVKEVAAKMASNAPVAPVATADAAQTVADAQIIKTGFLSKIGKFITSLPLKVKAFFGGLKGKSFSEIMKQGMAWLSANPMLALKTTGGIALVALLIRALKKRGQLNKYKQLQAIYDRGQSLKEDFEKDSLEAIAMNKVIEECQTNKALNNLIFGEEKVESKKSYFAY